jgi:hypothetical protein
MNRCSKEAPGPTLFGQQVPGNIAVNGVTNVASPFLASIHD